MQPVHAREPQFALLNPNDAPKVNDQGAPRLTLRTATEGSPAPTPTPAIGDGGEPMVTTLHPAVARRGGVDADPAWNWDQLDKSLDSFFERNGSAGLPRQNQVMAAIIARKILGGFNRLRFSDEGQRLALALELARVVPDDVPGYLLNMGFAPGADLTPLFKLCGAGALETPHVYRDFKADWFAVFLGRVRQAQDRDSAAKVARAMVLPQWGLTLAQKFKLAKLCLTLAPEECVQQIPHLGLSDEQRASLGCLYFEVPGSDTIHLQYLDFPDSRLTGAIAVAATQAHKMRVDELRRYVLRIEPPAAAFAVLAQVQMRTELRGTDFFAGLPRQARDPAPAPAHGLAHDPAHDLMQAWNLPHAAPGLARGLHAFSALDDADDLREALRASDDIITALLGAGIDKFEPDVETEVDELCILRSVVFFIHLHGYDQPQDLPLIAKLADMLAWITASNDDALRVDMFKAVFSLPRPVLENFDPSLYPKHTGFAALLLSAEKLPFFEAFFKPPFADSLKNVMIRDRLVRNLLVLMAGDSPAMRVKGLLPTLFPANDLDPGAASVRTASDQLAALVQDRKVIELAREPFLRAKAAVPPGLEAQFTQARSAVKAGEKALRRAKDAAMKAKKDTVDDVVHNTLQTVARLVVACEVAPRRLGKLDQQLAPGSSLKQALDALIQSIVIDKLDVPAAQYDRFQLMVGKYRDPSAILTYYSRIRRTPALAGLKTFIALCLATPAEEGFLAVRYNGAQLGAWPESMQQAWKQETRVKVAEGTAIFTGDPGEFFAMAMEILGSCQRVDGIPALIRALIGAIMDGTQKLFCIKDEHERIKARAIVRLMHHDGSARGMGVMPRKPMLFLERAYPPRTELRHAIRVLAGRQAEFMKAGIAIADDYIPSGRRHVMARMNGYLASAELAYPIYSDAAGGITEKSLVIRAPFED
ncbi:MAG: hypothetical protein JWP36_1947 [Paucimonas sp.]|nr:hypothetical protein [Paucimonas sp.]